MNEQNIIHQRILKQLKCVKCIYSNGLPDTKSVYALDLLSLNNKQLKWQYFEIKLLGVNKILN